MLGSSDQEERRSTVSASSSAGVALPVPPPPPTPRQSGFRKLQKLGEGTYGAVYKAMDKESGRIVALKRMVPMNEEEGIPATTIREIMLLKEMRHPNIVRLHDVLFKIPKLTLVFEFCDCDVKQLMDSRPGKQLHPQHEVLPFMWQLLSGLSYMHARSIVHRDIKPHNLLVSGGRHLKIADLGLGRVEGIPVKKYSHDAVTLWYRSPDVILGSVNYGLAVDVWSAGCVFAEMITGQPLFCGRTDREQLLRMFRLFGSPALSSWPQLKSYPNVEALLSQPGFEQPLGATFDRWVAENGVVEKVGSEAVNLLEQMLRFNPEARITAANALRHRCFSAFHRNTNATNPAMAPAAAGESAAVARVSNNTTTGACSSTGGTSRRSSCGGQQHYHSAFLQSVAGASGNSTLSINNVSVHSLSGAAAAGVSVSGAHAMRLPQITPDASRAPSPTVPDGVTPIPPPPPPPPPAEAHAEFRRASAGGAVVSGSRMGDANLHSGAISPLQREATAEGDAR